MDIEERFTKLIEQRHWSAFPAYTMRVWNYALVNIKPADARQLKTDYSRMMGSATFFGIVSVVYWNVLAMKYGITSKWLRLRWTAGSWVLGSLLSLPISYCFWWKPYSRAFMKQTLQISVNEWMYPTGLIQHSLLPNPPLAASVESTPNELSHEK